MWDWHEIYDLLLFSKLSFTETSLNMEYDSREKLGHGSWLIIFNPLMLLILNE